MNGTAPVLGPADRGRVAWHISSFSQSSNGNCVEAGPVSGTRRFAVRHSHHPDGVAFVVGGRQWGAFVRAAAEGELARPNR